MAHIAISTSCYDMLGFCCPHHSCGNHETLLGDHSRQVSLDHMSIISNTSWHTYICIYSYRQKFSTCTYVLLFKHQKMQQPNLIFQQFIDTPCVEFGCPQIVRTKIPHGGHRSPQHRLQHLCHDAETVWAQSKCSSVVYTLGSVLKIHSLSQITIVWRNKIRRMSTQTCISWVCFGHLSAMKTA